MAPSTTYDLALYPASGPGLGHLMRCMALAEWAVELKAKVIAITQESSLVWPCSLLTSGGISARIAIADGLSAQPGGGAQHWRIIDGLNDGSGPAYGYIYPHFGAVPVPGFPTFVGPQWMPLRRGFEMWGPGGKRAAAAVTYRAPTDAWGLPLRAQTGQQAAECFREAEAAWVPPSTVAYEALASGCALVLHRQSGSLEIGQAMHDAAVATWWDGTGGPPVLIKRKERPIDGLGAKRLLEALL